MNPKGRNAPLGAAIFIAACFGAPTNAVRVPRVELLREVRVAGSSVLLADLLPVEAGFSLRARAGEISLGATPQPGNTRVLERSGILENIGVSRDVAAEIAVPERIMVSRDVRSITAQEVLAAIRGALEYSEISTPAHLHPEDIFFQTQVLVGPGDAGLEVLRSTFDAGLKRGRFLLWPSRDPKVLPFIVTVRLAGDSPMAALHSMTEVNRAAGKPDSPPVAVVLAKTEILVSPGEQATLVLHSDMLRMIADVVPLERGAMGQRIHVRVVDTGKIFTAQVDGRAHLELNF
jgi:Chaperone for flagella basal body P-ring formation